MGGTATKRYLPYLDTKICRYLTNTHQFSKDLAYYIVTFAIEKRAALLYPLYDKILKAYGSNVNAKSIILEEANHLTEMESKLTIIANFHLQWVMEIENTLFEQWKQALIL